MLEPEWPALAEASADVQEEEEAALISASITDEQLQALTGTHDLDAVTFLQLAVDSSCVPLDTLGERLPCLEQLKMNNSSLPSIRELGTSLSGAGGGGGSSSGANGAGSSSGAGGSSSGAGGGGGSSSSGSGKQRASD